MFGQSILLSLVLSRCFLSSYAQDKKCSIRLLGLAARELKTDIFGGVESMLTDESVLRLAETGEWKGPDSVMEYIRFGTDESPYFSSTTKLATSYHINISDCSILYIRSGVSRIDRAFGNIASASQVMLKFFLNEKKNELRVGRRTEQLIEPIIDKIHVFFDVPWLEQLFGNILNSDSTRDFVCMTMRDECPDIWNENKLYSIDECKIKYLNLPVADAELFDFSGNCGACRVLHAAFALKNTDHCEHISFVPLEDRNGKKKCQYSSYISPLELFTEKDFNHYERFKEKASLPDDGFVSCDCDTNKRIGQESSNALVDPCKFC